MYSDLHNLYNQLDIVNLEYVLTKVLPNDSNDVQKAE